ncbi:zf-HC2 domain-containing protein [Anaerotignum sp.]
MRCEDCRELLWAYLEQELNKEETAKIQQHLEACADCRGEAEAQKEIMESLRSLPEEELPEGYHQELMQKLRAEAAHNVVPFPVKKKQPKWKQLSMIAAAALVVVAAGGINGMMEMRQSQNDAVRRIEATADTVAPFEIEEAIEESAMDETAEQPVETQKRISQTAENGKEAASGAEKKSAEPNYSDAVKDEKKADVPIESGGADAALPKVASMAEDEMAAPYSMIRSAAMAATDTAILQAADLETAKTMIRDSIEAAGGYEETASAENSIFAVIPVENFEEFGKALEGFGELQWTQKGKLAEGEAFRSVEIQLNQK